MDIGGMPGLSNVEQSLRQIITAINGINTSVEAVGVDVTSVATAVTAAFPPPLTSSGTWDPASCLTLTQTTHTIACSGVTLGMAVHPSFSLDLQAMTLTGYVDSANSVTVVLFNGTAGTVNLGSGTLKVRVYA
jgi:hypothetical protein